MRDDNQRKLKDRLQSHRPEWDKEAFWAKIEPELPKPEATKRPLWRWILPAFLLVSIAIYWSIPSTPALNDQNDKKEALTILEPKTYSLKKEANQNAKISIIDSLAQTSTKGKKQNKYATNNLAQPTQHTPKSSQKRISIFVKVRTYARFGLHLS